MVHTIIMVYFLETPDSHGSAYTSCTLISFQYCTDECICFRSIAILHACIRKQSISFRMHISYMHSIKVEFDRFTLLVFTSLLT